MKHFLAGLLLLAATPGLSQETEGEITIGEMLEFCQADAGLEEGFCLGYIKGYLDSHAVQAAASDPLFCLPGGWTLGQYEAVFVRWAKVHPPNSRHVPMKLAITAAFIAEFPCDEGEEVGS